LATNITDKYPALWPELLELARKVAACGSSGDAQTDDAIVDAIALVKRLEADNG
jgi:hypothetical protein